MRDDKLFYEIFVDKNFDRVFQCAEIPTGLSNEAGKVLSFATARWESNLQHVKQIKGPALGFGQMEPPTYLDLCVNYLAFHPSLMRVVKRNFPYFCESKPELLMWDTKFAMVMTRLHYWRVSEPMPSVSDVEGMAKYYKKHYNTPGGAATVEEFAKVYADTLRILGL